MLTVCCVCRSNKSAQITRNTIYCRTLYVPHCYRGMYLHIKEIEMTFIELGFLWSVLNIYMGCINFGQILTRHRWRHLVNFIYFTSASNRRVELVTFFCLLQRKLYSVCKMQQYTHNKSMINCWLWKEQILQGINSQRADYYEIYKWKAAYNAIKECNYNVF